MLRERLSAFVSEGGNPHNVLSVSRVEVFLPSELLAHGLVLIDTNDAEKQALQLVEEMFANIPDAVDVRLWDGKPWPDERRLSSRNIRMRSPGYYQLDQELFILVAFVGMPPETERYARTS